MKADNDLLLIARINEEVKTVVWSAHCINLLALNSILLSRRAGAVAAGFGVIADELRSFSKDLSCAMNTLRQLSYASVYVVSEHRRRERINKLLAQTTEKLQETGVELPAWRSDDRTQSLRQSLRKTYVDLQALLDEASDSTRFGSVIARSLKIEAAYGGEFSNMLAQIALEFSQSIDTIPGILGSLQRQVRAES